MAGGTEVQLVLSKGQRAQLARDGIATKLTRVKGGKTVKEFAAEQSENGFTVWRSWDEPGGFRDQMYAVARNNPQLAKLERIGTTYQGREILALKLTQGARGQADGSRPAVLYSSTQHAREWIANEVNRRLMNHYIDRWRANDPEIKKLLKDTELWFILVANPDGYEYTFDVERLWRKNLRDNNGDGQITVGDGVDPNRNFPNHFKYDEEGSSSITSSDTYRGPAPVSEPETVAMKGLLDRIGFAFQVNWHSNGQWLLYAEGWQIAHADGGRPDLLRPVGQPRPAGDPGLPPGPELRRPVRHQRRDDRLRPRRAPARWRGRPSCRRAAPTAGSCSRTTTRSCRRSSSATCRSRCRSPGRRTTRTTRCPCSASRRSRSTPRATTRTRTGSRASTSSSPTPTATRSRSRCWPSAASGP